ncbi:unnamed protein product [Prunus armeniaca]
MLHIIKVIDTTILLCKGRRIEGQMGSVDPMAARKCSREGLVPPCGWLVCDPKVHTKCSMKCPAEERRIS